jgi:hypothetical protein
MTKSNFEKLAKQSLFAKPPRPGDSAGVEGLARCA